MQIERRPVSLPQVIGWFVIVVVQAFIAGGVYISFQYRLSQIEESTDDREIQIDAKFAGIKASTDAIPNLTYRLGQAEERDKAQDARIDRIVEGITTKLDAINASVNAVRTDVQVLSSKVETSLNGAASMPPYRAKPTTASPL